MIQANELRIGNWFKDYDWKYFQWEIRHFELMNLSIDADEIISELIPLTEEILSKCNAVRRGGEWQITINDSTFIFKGDLNHGYYYTGGEGCKLSSYFYNLHELQNLFYAITKTELIFKP